MREVFFIIMVMFGLVGCKSAHQITNEHYQSAEDKVVVHKESVRTVRDTVVVTEYITKTEAAEASVETEMQEWWDNWTRQWVDSMGNTVVEVHETGNRNTNTKKLESMVSMMIDSLQSYKSRMDYYIAMDSMYRSFQENNTTKTEESIPKKKSSVLDKIMMFLGMMAFFALYNILWYLYIKRKK